VPDDEVEVMLLHEMAHAAVRRSGHGKVWEAEIERLISLGAPLEKELAAYRSKDVIRGPQIVEQAEHFAMEPASNWRNVRFWLLSTYELDPASALIAKCKRAYQKSRRRYRTWERMRGHHAE
jgi:hypothetical protein